MKQWHVRYIAGKYENEFIVQAETEDEAMATAKQQLHVELTRIWIDLVEFEEVK